MEHPHSQDHHFSPHRSSGMKSQLHSHRKPIRDSEAIRHVSPSPSRHHRRKHHHHRPASRHSTSRSPLRGRRRHSSRPRSTYHTTSDDPKSNSKKPPFHSGLHDILHGLFGHGERGPTAADIAKLADDFGDLVVKELVDLLVIELRNGLLEKLLVQYLETLVMGAVKNKVGGRSGHKGKGKGNEDSKEVDEDWKKGLLKKAALTLTRKLMR